MDYEVENNGIKKGCNGGKIFQLLNLITVQMFFLRMCSRKNSDTHVADPENLVTVCLSDQPAIGCGVSIHEQ